MFPTVGPVESLIVRLPRTSTSCASAGRIVTKERTVKDTSALLLISRKLILHSLPRNRRTLHSEQRRILAISLREDAAAWEIDVNRENPSKRYSLPVVVRIHRPRGTAPFSSKCSKSRLGPAGAKTVSGSVSREVALRSATVITFIDEPGERGRITAAIAVACQWQIRGRSVLLADASADGHIRAFAEAATAAGLPIPPVIRIGAENLRRVDQLQSLAQDHDLVVIEC